MKLQLILIFLVSASLVKAQSTSIDLQENFFGTGGAISLSEETGTTHTTFEPDIDGNGGFFLIQAGAGPAFVIDGNDTANQPQVSIGSLFSNSSSVFNTFNTGNNSVVLPVDAINSVEIENEVGLASENANFVNITNSFTTLATRTIDVPSDGYVLAIGSGQLQIAHNTGTNSYVDLGISQSNNSLPGNMDVGCGVSGGFSSGTILTAACVQGVFSVSEGVETFYFLGRDLSGSGNKDLLEINFSLIFIPTAYGTASSNLIEEVINTDKSLNDNPPSYGMTENEIKKEKIQSLAANQARMEKEMAEMKALIAEMTKNSDNRPPEK